MITLPEDWLTQLKTPVGELFNDLAPIIFLLIGIFVGIFIIEKIISLVRGEPVD